MKTILSLTVILLLCAEVQTESWGFVYGKRGPVEVEAIREEPSWYLPQSNRPYPAFEKMDVARWEHRNQLEREYLGRLKFVGLDFIIPKPGKAGDLRPVYEKVNSREWDRRNQLEIQEKKQIVTSPIFLEQESTPRLLEKPQVVTR